MEEIINIRTAELAVAKAGQILRTGSIGSCLVIIIYDEEKKLGGLAHAMLPQLNVMLSAEEQRQYPAKYVTQAIDNLLQALEQLGAARKNLKVKLIGGAAMFKRINFAKSGIGTQNLTQAKKYLAQLELPILAEDTGGSAGKSVEFDPRNGVVDVHTLL